MRHPRELAVIVAGREYEVLTWQRTAMFCFTAAIDCNVLIAVPVKVAARQDLERISEIVIFDDQQIAFDRRDFQAGGELVPAVAVLLRVLSRISLRTFAHNEYWWQMAQRSRGPVIITGHSRGFCMLKVAQHEAPFHK